MRKIILIALTLSISLTVFSQTLILRSGFHSEKANVPNNGMLFHGITFTSPAVDLLLSFNLSENISFQTGLKYIPYENCAGIKLPEFIGMWTGNPLYQALGVPLLINTRLPIKLNRFKIYIITGIVPTYTFAKESNIFTYSAWKSDISSLYRITEIHRVSDRKFNMLLNTGIGVSYSFKHFDIGLITEYHSGTYTVVTSDIIIEHIESGVIYNYQATSKGSFFTINAEIAFPLFKPKNN